MLPWLAWMARRGSAVGAVALVAGACGPSFQVMYEGDARFEHCYAMDDTPTIPLQEKSDCWTQWMKSYTYGQTRNRVDYAAMRAHALLEVHAAPTDEAIMSAAPGEGVGHEVGHDEPVTTNAFAPPPKTMNVGDAGPESGENGGVNMTHDTAPVVARPVVPVSVASVSTPHEPCTERCRSDWQTCRGTCKTKICPACDGSYGGCMKKCF